MGVAFQEVIAFHDTPVQNILGCQGSQVSARIGKLELSLRTIRQTSDMMR